MCKRLRLDQDAVVSSLGVNHAGGSSRCRSSTSEGHAFKGGKRLERFSRPGISIEIHTRGASRVQDLGHGLVGA